MKASTLIAVAAVASLGLSSLSFAQGYDRERHDNRQGYEQRGGGRQDDQRSADRRDNEHRARHGRADWRDRDARNRMGYNADTRSDSFHYGARGPEWHRGGHVPPLYRSHQYVVNDWRAHRLSPPPRGYEWVQVGPDYVLIAVGSGIIAQLVLSP
jgi:Ni/Co efflux regulator RcnB